MKIAIQNAILSDLQKINNLVRLSKGYWGEFNQYQRLQDKMMESDFDRELKKILKNKT
jgi:hypothetical protein